MIINICHYYLEYKHREFPTLYSLLRDINSIIAGHLNDYGYSLRNSEIIIHLEDDFFRDISVMNVPLPMRNPIPWIDFINHNNMLTNNFGKKLSIKGRGWQR